MLYSRSSSEHLLVTEQTGKKIKKIYDRSGIRTRVRRPVFKEVTARDPKGALNLVYQYIQTLQALSPLLTRQTHQGIFPHPLVSEGGRETQT
jgi:hypothetical protein